MRAIFKNQFLGAFRRAYGYVTVALLLLASAIPFIVYNVLVTSESVATALSVASIFSALIIPVVAINSYPNVKKANTDAAYDMMPVSAWDVVAGKYLASLALIMLPGICVLLYPMIAGMLGAADHLFSFSVILGYFATEAALLAVCTFITKVTKSRAWSYVVCYVSIVLWYFLPSAAYMVPLSPWASLICFVVLALAVGALVWLTCRKVVLAVCVSLGLGTVLALGFLLERERFVGLFERFCSALSPFVSFNSFVRGVIDLGGVVLLVSLIAVFLFLTWRAYQLGYEPAGAGRRLDIRRFTSFSVALAIIGSALALTGAAAMLPDRYSVMDATLTRKHSVSDEAKNFIAGVDKDVTVYLLESTNIPEYEAYLDKLTASSPRIRLEKIYAAQQPQFYADRGISTDSISANSLVVQSGERISYVSYQTLFFYSNEELGVDNMTYSQYQYYLSMFSSNAQYATYLQSLLYGTTTYIDADEVICSHIEYVTKDIIPTNYYLTGHGEISVLDSSCAYSGLGLSELDISGADVPADAATVLVNMPRTDLSAAERDRLLAYLDTGGQVTFVTDEACLDMPNLCAVLAAYGMSANKGTVKQGIEVVEGEPKEYLSEFEPKLHTDNDVLYDADADSAFIPSVKDANAIIVDDGAVPNMTVIPLLSSTSDSYTGENTDTLASYTLACAVDTPKGARVAWFTGGEAFNKPRSDSVAVVLYALSWTSMEYESNTGNIAAALYTPATATPDSFLSGIIEFVLVALPVGVGVFGALTLNKRKKRK